MEIWNYLRKGRVEVMKVGSFLKEKLDSKENERIIVERGKTFIIRMQVEKKDLERKIESLKRKIDKIYFIIGLNLLVFFNVLKKRDIDV